MANKKAFKIFLTFILIIIMLPNLASAGWFDEVKEHFAKKGNNVPEYRCTVHFKNFESNNIIQSSEKCMPYFIAHKNIGHTCQIYSKYDDKKGIKQCDFCIDRYLSKTDKKNPKRMLRG